MTKPDLIGAAKLEQLRKAAEDYMILRLKAEEEARKQAEIAVAAAKAKRDSLALEAEALRRDDPGGFGHGLSKAAIKRAGRFGNHAAFQELADTLDFTADDLGSKFVGEYQANDYLGQVLVTKIGSWHGEALFEFGRNPMDPALASTNGYFLTLVSADPYDVPEITEEFQTWAFGLRP